MTSENGTGGTDGTDKTILILLKLTVDDFIKGKPVPPVTPVTLWGPMRLAVANPGEGTKHDIMARIDEHSQR